MQTTVDDDDDDDDDEDELILGHRHNSEQSSDEPLYTCRTNEYLFHSIGGKDRVSEWKLNVEFAEKRCTSPPVRRVRGILWKFLELYIKIRTFRSKIGLYVQ